MSNLNLNSVTSLDTGREVDVNRVMQTVDYVGGLVIDSLDTVIVDGDNRYVLAASAVLPYTTTGAGMPEGGAFVSVGDAVLRQDLSSAQGSALVHHIASGALSGRSVKSKLDDILSIKDFGAVGDGVSDDFNAIQACFSYAATIGAVGVYIPSGRYLLSNKIYAEIDNKTFERGFSVFGDGPLSSQLIARSDNQNGILKLADKTNQTSIYINNFSCISLLHTVNNPAQSNGTAIEVTSLIDANTPGFGDRGAFGALIENIHIAGSGDNSGATGSTGRWSRGIVVENMWYPTVRSCHVMTVNEDVAEHGVRFLDCYDPRTELTYVRGPWDFGIWHDTIRTASAPSYEGGYVNTCTIVGAFTAVFVGHISEISLYEPGFHIVNCHMNPKNYGVHIRHHRQIVISGNYWYVSGQSESTVLLPAAIFLDRASDVTIGECQFLEPGFYVSDANASCGIVIGEGTSGVSISGNIFNHGGIGVVNQSTFGQRNIVGSNLVRAGQTTGHWAPFKYVIDPLNTLNFSGLSENRLNYQHTDTSTSNIITGINISRKRGDYATNADAFLSGVTFQGLNSEGIEVLAGRLSVDWADNTSGAETASITFFQRRGGSNHMAWSITDDGIFNAPKGFRAGGNDGVTGTFTSNDGRTVVVTNGLITGIV